MRNFAVLTLAFCFTVFLTNCSDTSSGNTENSASADKAGNSSSQANGTEFPLLPERIANAEIEMLDGSFTKISDRKGKVLLLNLWATWCGPCRDEMPHLVEMQEKYGDKNFQVIGLNVGERDSGEPESLETITAFTDRIKVNYELARIEESLTVAFSRITKQEVVPQTFLIDREGRMRGAFAGGGPRIINSMKRSVEKVVNE